MNALLLSRGNPVGIFRTVRRALNWLGTPDAKRYHQVHPRIKSLMINARRAGEDDMAAELSQLSAFLKKKMRRGCAVCDAALAKQTGGRVSNHCRQHFQSTTRGNKRTLVTPLPLPNL